MRYQAPRGTEDVLPGDSYKWLKVESTFRDLTRRYGYLELRTPTFEDTEVFLRTAGETSDIVSKEMYTFLDKGGRSITLKPEGTAPAMRALLEHNLCPPGVVLRMSYIMPVFRYDRPQKGRYREPHQVGLELVGSPSAAADAEIIEITIRFYEALGIGGAKAKLNSIGREECRARFGAVVLERMASFLADQPPEYRDRAAKNPLRLLDSKDPDAQEAVKAIPPITDYLEPESRARFEELQRLLTNAGVDFELDAAVVRGLDYYTETVFEVHTDKLGAQSALCGGGRYDNLIRQMGGPPTPSVGVAMGIERAILVMEESGLFDGGTPPDVFVVQATEGMFDKCLEIARCLRDAGMTTLMDIDGKSMKSQLRQADKSNAKLALILGDDELARGVVQVKRLGAGAQMEAPLDDLVEQVSLLL